MGKLILAALVSVFVVWVACPHKGACHAVQLPSEHTYAGGSEAIAASVHIFEGTEEKHVANGRARPIQVFDPPGVWKAAEKFALRNQLASLLTKDLGEGLEFTRLESFAGHRAQDHSFKRHFEVDGIINWRERYETASYGRFTAANISKLENETPIWINVHVFENNFRPMFGEKLQPHDLFLLFYYFGLIEADGQLPFREAYSVNSRLGGRLNVFGLILSTLGEPPSLKPQHDGGGGKDQIKKRFGLYQKTFNPKPKGTNWPLVAGVGVGGAILVAIGGWSRILDG